MTIAISPSIVRRAIPDDHQGIWKLFLQAHAENGLFPLAPDKVEFFIQRALYPERIQPGDNGPRGEIRVIGPKGKPEAICFVLIGQFWYSNGFHLEELIIFVDSEARQSNHAKALIIWMKQTAEELGIPVLTGIMSTHRTAGKIRLYDRLLPRIGGFYLWPLPQLDVKKPEHTGDWASPK